MSGIGFARFRDGGAAEVGEVEPGDRASELEGRRQRRVHLFARGVEHPAGRALRVGVQQRFRERPIRRFERRFPNEEMPLRCDRQFVHRAAVRSVRVGVGAAQDMAIVGIGRATSRGRRNFVAHHRHPM